MKQYLFFHISENSKIWSTKRLLNSWNLGHFILYFTLNINITSSYVDTIRNNELTLYHIHSNISINNLHGRFSEKKKWTHGVRHINLFTWFHGCPLILVSVAKIFPAPGYWRRPPGPTDPSPLFQKHNRPGSKPKILKLLFFVELLSSQTE